MALLITDCLQPPFSIGPDKQGRPQIAFNVRIVRDPADGDPDEEEFLSQLSSAIKGYSTPWRLDVTEDRIHLGSLPDDSPNVGGRSATANIKVAIFEYQGPQRTAEIGSGRHMTEELRAQIMCRGGNAGAYRETRQQAERLYRIVDSLDSGE